MRLSIGAARETHIGKRIVAMLFVALVATLPVHGAESCKTIHGRAHLYGGDGQLRIWQIGTHHEYAPDESSWDTVIGWLESGVRDSDKAKYASPASMLYLFGDFVICPTEPFKQGSVQRAKIKSVIHKHFIRTG